jgi:FkbM family methyltransferase
MKSVNPPILCHTARTVLRPLLRLNPFYRGGVRAAQTAFVTKLSQDLPLKVTRLRGGPHLLVDPNEYSGRAIFYTGDYDRRITWICRQLLRPGDCFLDIGACLGEVGFYAAQFVGPSGQVHLFEPQPRSANRIRVSAELNRFKHVFIHEIALSDQDGSLDFFVPRGHTGMGSLTTSGHGEVDTLKVRVQKSGTYLDKLHLPRIRAVKIDVEGHEEQVIGGAMDFLRLNKPAAIIFECHDDGQPFFERGLVKVISSLGYEFFQIRQKIWLRVQLKKLKSSNVVEHGFDFVALSTSPEHDDVCRLLGTE